MQHTYDLIDPISHQILMFAGEFSYKRQDKKHHHCRKMNGIDAMHMAPLFQKNQLVNERSYFI